MSTAATVEEYLAELADQRRQSPHTISNYRLDGTFRILKIANLVEIPLGGFLGIIIIWVNILFCHLFYFSIMPIFYLTTVFMLRFPVRGQRTIELK